MLLLSSNPICDGTTLRNTGLALALVCLGSSSCASMQRDKPSPPIGGIIATLAVGDGRADGAAVQLRDATGTTLAEAKTNRCGVAVFEPVPEGNYLVAVPREGKKEVTRRAAVKHQQETALWFALGEDARQMKAQGPECVPPQRLSGPDPQYTSEAFEQNAEGCVILKCVILRSGAVRDCFAQSGEASMLTSSAIKSLQLRNYEPMRCGGLPVDSEYVYYINFRMTAWSN